MRREREGKEEKKGKGKESKKSKVEKWVVGEGNQVSGDFIHP